jgi:4-diphosphocytidyl-2C-methyl-D-erythritol kinase
MLGAGGGTSTAAMVACCLHHLTDLLPLLGLSAAASFLAAYKIPFMLVGLAMNLAGISAILRAIRREQRHVQHLVQAASASTRCH